MREHKKNCMFCNKPYIAMRSDGMYCSDSCKVQAFFKRRGLAPRNKGLLIHENRVLRQAIEIYMDITTSILPSLNVETKEKIIKINTELKKIV